jgi:predicted cation transporter
LVELLQDARREAAIAAAMRAKLARDTVTLGDLLGAVPEFETLAAALMGGFRTELQIETVFWADTVAASRSVS